ncbi:MAG: Ig-like domain-containing protein [Prevotella sp.]|nr:Ig-like domain-containing protein [Prevotella sp.]
MLLLVGTLLSGNLQAQKVHTLGDSTMAPYDESTETKRGWGMYFGNFLTDGWTSVNYAKGGRDSRGGYNELWQNAKNKVNAGDYVIIQFAHNDGKYNGVDNEELQQYYTAKGDATNAAAVKSDGRGTTPSTTYKVWLKKIIDEVKEKGATPVLVSAVSRCYFSGESITKAGQHNLADKYSIIKDGEYLQNQKLTTDDHSMDYTYQMEQLAKEEGVSFINMTKATADLYISYGSAKCHDALFCTGDNTHYNLTGALMVARLCAQKLKEAGILAEHIEIPSDLAFTPSTADMGDVYVGQYGVKELTLTGIGLEPAKGTATITASEGIQLSTDKQNWNTEVTADYESGTLIKTIYAKVNVNATGTFTGTVTATIGEKTVTVPVSINGIELGGGDPFTATWTLTSDDKAVVETAGLATAADAKIAGMVKYKNDGTDGLMVSTSDNGAWAKAEDDSPNQYVQFTVTAPDGRKLDINKITMNVMARGGNGLRCHVYYSTDGFVNRTAIFAPASMTNKQVYAVDATPVVSLEEGEQLQIRVYPWYNGDVTGKWLCVRDVVIGGQSKDAAGVNITGTISYALDKGGITQGDDVVFDPTTLSAGFVGKTWSAGSALTVEGTQSYQGDTSTKTLQTKILNGTGSSLSSSATVDNTMTLTLTPEDGFSFVPTKLTFEAARYGTDTGNISATVETGNTTVDLVTDASVNRGGKSLPLKTFSENISGVTATADEPLKINFAFLGLGKTKSMGISNVVVEGTLVGSAAKVTKYLLTTAVVPAEAGSITREPDLEQYKEGSVVTLKASKNFGYKFKEWQDAAGTVVSTDAETTVTMDAEKTMKAVFEAVPVYTVKTEVTDDADRELGSITLSPNDHSGQYEEGTVITATANESKILKFLNWTDKNENAGAGATRELTVNSDMTLTANYEVQDFIAVFDASTTASYAYPTTGGYPFSADVTWDTERKAKSCVVKMVEGAVGELAYTNDGSTVGKAGTPVVRNRQSVVLSTINGLYQNGYRSSDIAFQYQFSTKGFTTATFAADMAAKNMALKNWKAMISVDDSEFADLGEGWQMTANTQTPLSLELPQEAIDKEKVVIRITGTGTEMLSDKYTFDQTFDGLTYTSNSECGVGNVFVLGSAVVVPDEVAPVVKTTIPADKATAVSATGKITITFDEKIKEVEDADAATLNGIAMVASWSNRSVSFEYTGLEYNTAYTFTMPANFVQDHSGNKLAEAVTINFTTMDKPTVTKGTYDFVVPDNGTITEALNAANSREDKNSRYRIFIKNGNYVFDTNGTTTGGDEKTYPDPRSYLKAPNTSFIGESMEGVVITNQTPEATWNNGFGTACPLEGIGNGDVLIIESAATNTYFQNLTIKSSMGDAHGRDIALNDKSNRTIFKDACLWAYQDTYVSNNQNGKFYFEGGVLRGRTDYLCGKGDVYYNKVTLRQIAGGYLAVPSVPKKYGYIFQNCKIVGDADGVNGTYTLGRPWGEGTPIALFINTEMEVIPSAIGWYEMSNGWPKRFAEYNSVNSKGVAIDLSSRKTIFGDNHENNPVLTAEEAAVPTLEAVMGQDDNWQPTLYTEQAPVPANVKVSGTTLTWDGNDYTLLWAVCCNGNVVAFTLEPTYTATVNGTYTVRAANEMGGLSGMSASVEVSGADGILTVSATGTSAVEAIYTIDGKRIGKPQRGVNIVRMGDGSVRKVLVK